MEVLTQHRSATQSVEGGGYQILASSGADGLVKNWTYRKERGRGGKGKVKGKGGSNGTGQWKLRATLNNGNLWDNKVDEENSRFRGGKNNDNKKEEGKEGGKEEKNKYITPPQIYAPEFVATLMRCQYKCWRIIASVQYSNG